MSDNNIHININSSPSQPDVNSNLGVPAQAPTVAPHRKLINEVANWNFGDLHYHNEISAILGIPYKITTSLGTIEVNPHYNKAVSKANNILTKQGRMLGSVKGSGYELLKHGEYAVASGRKLKEAMKKAKKSIVIHESADVNLMTVDEKVRHDSVGARALPFYKLAIRTVERVKEIIYPKHDYGTPRSIGNKQP
jgi:hypothetical protein